MHTKLLILIIWQTLILFYTLVFNAPSFLLYQVSILAVEKSVLLTWTRDKLTQNLNSNPSLAAIFNILIGKDISDKLYQIQEMLLSNPKSPLGRKNGPCAHRIQSVCPSPNPSLINLRSALAANGSMSSQDHLNTYDSDLNGI